MHAQKDRQFFISEDRPCPHIGPSHRAPRAIPEISNPPSSAWASAAAQGKSTVLSLGSGAALVDSKFSISGRLASSSSLSLSGPPSTHIHHRPLLRPPVHVNIHDTACLLSMVTPRPCLPWPRSPNKDSGNESGKLVCAPPAKREPPLSHPHERYE